MANYVTITLDTTAPASPTVSIDGGAVYATNQLVTLTIGTTDGDTTGYQMMIWGNVDESYNESIKATEGTSAWITFATTQQVKLSATDGSKTINVKIRDDVWNTSSQATDSITLDTTLPTVTVSALDVTKISKISGKDTANFTFQSDTDFAEFKVCLVGTTGAINTAGTVIPTTAGSTGTSGTGAYTAAQVMSVSIKGTDLETAGASTDGDKIIKCFVKDNAGNWSV